MATYNNLTPDQITQLEFQAGKEATKMFDDILSNKLDAQLSSADNGKILQVGANGKVTPVKSSTGVTIDDTLSISGSAADSAATGAAIAAAKEDISALDEHLDWHYAPLSYDMTSWTMDMNIGTTGAANQMKGQCVCPRYYNLSKAYRWIGDITDELGNPIYCWIAEYAGADYLKRTNIVSVKTFYLDASTTNIRIAFGTHRDADISMTAERAEAMFALAALYTATEIKSDIKAITHGYVPDTKKYYALGDSVTEGMYANIGSSSATGTTQYGYPYWVALINGYDLTNLGEGGSGFALAGDRGGNGKSIVDANDFSDADIVTIAWGVNDWKAYMTKSTHIAMGSVTTSTKGDGTAIGQMMYVIETIAAQAPLAQIIVLLPKNTSRWGGDLSTEYGFDLEIDGHTLREYRAAIKACAEHYHLKVVDPEEVCPMNLLNITQCLGDGAHPTRDYYKLMGTTLAPYIK